MKENFVAAAWIFSSIFFSTVLISLNKYITRTYSFDFMVTMTSFHFLVTYFLLEIMCRMGLFERAVEYPRKDRWILALYGVGSVVGMNFNLEKNSVGFYQLSKLCTIPALVVYNLLVNKKKTPLNILGSLAILLAGVGLYSVNDVELNTVGTIIAALAVVATAAFQLSAGSDQGKYSISGPQLQHASAFPQFVLCFCAALATEIFNPRHSIRNHNFTRNEILTIVLTAVLAVGVNVSCFGIIGKTSALTYQVVGHVKTVLILLCGFIFFPPKTPVEKPVLVRTGIGMIVAMVGVILYSAFGMKNKAREEETRAPPVFAEPQDDKKHVVEAPLPANLFTPDEPKQEEV